jgi:hypothetical protein
MAKRRTYSPKFKSQIVLIESSFVTIPLLLFALTPGITRPKRFACHPLFFKPAPEADYPLKRDALGVGVHAVVRFTEILDHGVVYFVSV